MGTLLFSSIAATRGEEQSRKDDLQALGYVMAYFLNEENLVWRKIIKTMEELNNIGLSETEVLVAEMKETLPHGMLFHGSSEEFTAYMTYCQLLPFEDKPDYNFLKDLFLSVI